MAYKTGVQSSTVQRAISRQKARYSGTKQSTGGGSSTKTPEDIYAANLKNVVYKRGDEVTPNMSTEQGEVYAPPPSSSSNQQMFITPSYNRQQTYQQFREQGDPYKPKVITPTPNMSTESGQKYVPPPRSSYNKSNSNIAVLKDGTLSLATTQQAKQQRMSSFTRVYTPLKEGFLLKQDENKYAINSIEQRSREAGQMLGAASLFGIRGVGTGYMGVGTAARQTKGYKYFSNLYNVAATKSIGKTAATYSVNFGKSVISGGAIVKAGQFISNKYAPQDQQLFSEESFFPGVVSRAHKAEGQAVRDSSLLGYIAYEGMGTMFSTKKDVFKESVRSDLQNMGLSDYQVSIGVAAATRSRKASGVSEIVALLDISRRSERTGRALLSSAFIKKEGTTIAQKKAGLEMFKITAPRVGLAGTQEGVAQEIYTQTSRGQPITTKGVVVAGVGGFISAGLIGGSIAGLKPKTLGKSKTLEYVAYLTDPAEKPGDILADITDTTLRKAGRSVPTTPVLTQPISPTDIITIGKGKRTTPPQDNPFTIGRGKSTPVDSMFQPGTPVNTKPNTIIVPSKPTPKEPTPIIPVTFTPTKPSTIISTDTFTNPKTNTNINVLTNINTNINIPAFVPLVRNPMGLLPVGGFSTGSGRGKGKRRVKGKRMYVPSIEASFLNVTGGSGSFGYMSGVGIRPKIGKMNRNPKKTQKKMKGLTLSKPNIRRF